MKVKCTYPSSVKKTFKRLKTLNVLRWPYWALLLACPIVNLCVGGPWWSVVADFGLYMAWSMIFDIDLIEFNRISQMIKGIIKCIIMLVLIEVLLAPGWASLVVPIVCFGGLIVCAILFYTDFETQKHNLMPLLILCVMAIIASIVCVSAFQETRNWAVIVMGAVSFTLLIVLAITLGGEFFKELKRRFHVE
jgi:peptidoglycan/LPS O-acetylase OafA/YrhL